MTVNRDQMCQTIQYVPNGMNKPPKENEQFDKCT